MFSKGVLRLGVIDNSQSRIVNLDAIRVRPHLIELVISLYSDHCSSIIVLYHSNFESIAGNVLEGEVWLEVAYYRSSILHKV